MGAVGHIADKFSQSSGHLHNLPHGKLGKNYSELLTLAENYLQDKVTPVMVDCLEQATCEQSSRNFRAGRITASRLKPILYTDPHQPSLPLLKSLCYPEIQRFNVKATSWG